MDGGDGCNNVNVLNATELYTETLLKWQILCYEICISPQFKI